jgi:hypothetical protein
MARGGGGGGGCCVRRFATGDGGELPEMGMEGVVWARVRCLQELVKPRRR